MWRYLLFRVAARVVPHLSEKVGYSLFGGLADLMFIVAWRTRRLVVRNMTQALGAGADRADARQLARHAFRNLLWNYYEMFHMPKHTLEELRERVHIEGVRHGEEAVDAGGPLGLGTIFVFPHIGNLEILMQIPLLYPQYRFIILVERMGDDRVFRLLRNLRGTHGLQVVPVSEMLRIMRLFREGWCIVLGGDFDSTGSGIVVDYFGAPARMPDGAVRLALRTGAPLLIGYGWREAARSCADGEKETEVRQPGGSQDRRVSARFRLCITRPVPLVRTDDFRADVQRGEVAELGATHGTRGNHRVSL